MSVAKYIHATCTPVPVGYMAGVQFHYNAMNACVVGQLAMLQTIHIASHVGLGYSGDPTRRDGLKPTMMGLIEKADREQSQASPLLKPLVVVRGQQNVAADAPRSGVSLV